MLFKLSHHDLFDPIAGKFAELSVIFGAHNRPTIPKTHKINI